MIASYLGGMAAGFVGCVHPLSAGLSMVLDIHHGLANLLALSVLDDIYPKQHAEVMAMMEKQGITLPKGVCRNLTDEQFTRLYEGSIVHEKPLTNALGPNYRDILTKENVIARFKKLYAGRPPGPLRSLFFCSTSALSGCGGGAVMYGVPAFRSRGERRTAPGEIFHETQN